MSLYLAPTAAAVAAAGTATLPRRRLVLPHIDIRRHPERRGRDMALVMPPPPLPPPPPLVRPNRHMPACAKHKAVVVMGATGTGKTRLAVDLALQFGGEVINSDKIQLYAGLDVVTNKASDEECAGVPHHLLGVAHPDAEFTAEDFRREASRAALAVTARGRIPIIAGGSNSYVEELVDGDGRTFRDRYDCCFLWVDVQLPVLHGFVDRRVDTMCDRGLVEEVAAAIDRHRTDYSRGVWRAIGVPELDAYLRSCCEKERARLLDIAVEEIKSNTRRLSCRQRQKIQRLAKRWRVGHVDATEAFRVRGAAADEAWERLVSAPCTAAVRAFLYDDLTAPIAIAPLFAPAPAVAAAGV